MTTAEDRARDSIAAIRADMLKPGHVACQSCRKSIEWLCEVAEQGLAERAGRDEAMHWLTATQSALRIEQERATDAERLVGALRARAQLLIRVLEGTEPHRSVASAIHDLREALADDSAARLGAEWAALRTLYERTAEMRRLFNQGGTGNVGGQMIKVFEAVDEVERAGLAQ